VTYTFEWVPVISSVHCIGPKDLMQCFFVHDELAEVTYIFLGANSYAEDRE
jgi:hypothetical protein